MTSEWLSGSFLQLMLANSTASKDGTPQAAIAGTTNTVPQDGAVPPPAVLSAAGWLNLIFVPGKTRCRLALVEGATPLTNEGQQLVAAYWY